MSPGARTRQVTGSSSPSMASTSPTRAKTRLLTAAPGTAGPIPREAPSPGAYPARAHEFVEVADRPHQRVRHLVNSHPAGGCCRTVLTLIVTIVPIALPRSGCHVGDSQWVR